VAVISAEDAVSYSLTGPTLRGSGVNYDVRKAEPYAAYADVEWEVPLGKNGDTYDRYFIRVEEIRQSARIVSQCLDKLPDGPISIDVPGITYPSKDRVMVDMESLIHHFKMACEESSRPRARSIAPPRRRRAAGILHQQRRRQPPYRLKIRSPSFVHLGAFDHMARGYLIADIVTIFGTYDVVMGECDR
jgi:NADH-quinone oxidoreductase subunit C/D